MSLEASARSSGPEGGGRKNNNKQIVAPKVGPSSACPPGVPVAPAACCSAENAVWAAPSPRRPQHQSMGARECLAPVPRCRPVAPVWRSARIGRASITEPPPTHHLGAADRLRPAASPPQLWLCSFAGLAALRGPQSRARSAAGRALSCGRAAHSPPRAHTEARPT